MRLLFAGTPEVAVPSLQALVDSGHEVCAVLTRPDAAAGRGRRPSRSAVAERADALGIPVWTPASLRDPDALAELASMAPDCCPVVAYGALIPAAALAVPRHGWLNVHFSLLPAWRGAAPVQYAVLHGDSVTGATVFRLDEGLDTGPVLSWIEEPIGPRDTSGEVLDRLAVRGAQLLVDTIASLASGGLAAIPQPAEGATYAPKLDVSDARVDWARPAHEIDRRIRACTPVPGAWTTFRGDRIKVSPIVLDVDDSLAPGEIRASKAGVLVGTGTVAVAMTEVRPEGRKPMAAADWVRGVRPTDGEAFG